MSPEDIAAIRARDAQEQPFKQPQADRRMLLKFLDAALAEWRHEGESLQARINELELASMNPPTSDLPSEGPVEFAIWTGADFEDFVAQVCGPRDMALADARHYAAQALGDGNHPVLIEEVTRRTVETISGHARCTKPDAPKRVCSECGGTGQVTTWAYPGGIGPCVACGASAVLPGGRENA